jgi:protein O-GlcNAc transferase
MIYKSDATNIENLLLLGSAHLNLKNHSEALFFFQQGLKVDPQCGEALSNLGNVLKELGDSQGAIQCYLKAIKLKPRFADTYNNLATVYAELGRISQAVETYVVRFARDRDENNINQPLRIL